MTRKDRLGWLALDGAGGAGLSGITLIMSASMQQSPITPEDALYLQEMFTQLATRFPMARDPLVKVIERITKTPISVPPRANLELRNILYRITPELAAQTPLEPAILTVNGVELMSRYSLVGLNGDISAGKTPIALLLACMAINPACGAQEEIVGGLTMTALQGNVLYFDTEIEKDRLCHTVQQSWQKRLKHKKHDVARLCYYPLRHVPTPRRMQAVEMLLDEIGDIGFVVIDSLTQMVADKLDYTEATGVIDRLLELIDKYRFPILGTIHGNRGDDTGKATGHIGAVLQEKASTYLRLMHHPNDEDARILTANFPNGKVRWGKRHEATTAFRWEADLRSFVECEFIEPDDSKLTAKQETSNVLMDIFRRFPKEFYGYTELLTHFQDRGMAKNAAKARISRSANGWNLLIKTGDKYVIRID